MNDKNKLLILVFSSILLLISIGGKLRYEIKKEKIVHDTIKIHDTIVVYQE